MLYRERRLLRRHYATDIATMQIHGAFAEALINDGTLTAFKEKMEALINEFYEPEFDIETTDSTQPPEP